MAFWGQKTFCVVTGASKGIGQAIAHTFSKNVGAGSLLLLLARNEQALEQTKLDILKNPENKCEDVITTSIDLSSPDAKKFQSIFEEALNKTKSRSSDFTHSILVQCAASHGIDKGWRTDQLEDVEYIRSYYDFNLTSYIVLNSVFCKVFGLPDDDKQTTIVHITSSGAVEPYKTWGLYCAARAAKEMILRSIALESPHIRTINYAPGMVYTDNYKEAIQHTSDKELVKLLEKEHAEGRTITPAQTAERLVKILGLNKYAKGEHVQYSDYDPEMKK